MRRCCPPSFLISLALLLLAGSAVAFAQGVPEPRGPQFLLASASPAKAPVVVDAGSVASLRRRVSLSLDGVRVGEALAEISRASGLQIVYADGVVPSEGRVHFRAEEITVAAALTEVLLDAGVDVLISPGGSVVLVKRGAVQTGSVAGRVTDAKTAQGIPTVLITITGTRHTAITGDSGQYRIVGVPPGSYTVTARRIGYGVGAQSVVVAGDTELTVNFVLTATPSQLEAVVVTVTGEQRLAELGNVVGRVNVDSLMRSAPIKNFDDLLTARIPGVDVRQASGFTGQSTNIRIRGINSLTVRSEPIVLVDGVRVDNQPGDIALNTDGSHTQGFNASFSGYGQWSGALTNLTPDEIESVEVVKGASATTLYGTDAANGVIVITTKHGRVGKPELNVFSEAGVGTATGPTWTNYYAWGHSLSTGAPTQCALQGKASGQCVIDSVTHFNPLEDPQTTMLSTGNREHLGAQLSGGVRAVRYFMSGDFERELGDWRMPAFDQQRLEAQRRAAIPDYELHPNALRKVSLRGNVTGDLGGKGDITVSTGFLTNLVRIPSTGAIEAAAYGPGYMDSISHGYNAGYPSPGDLFSVKGDQHMTRFTGSVTANYRPMDWLAAHATTGVDFSGTFLDGLQLAGEGPPGGTGSRWNSRETVTLYSVDLGAKATAMVSPILRSNTAVGVQYNRKGLGTTIAAGNGLLVGAETGTGAQTQYIGEFNQENVVAGAYVEQAFGLRDRLFLTAGLRGDGSSGFGSNFRTALYPKVSASWIISQEPFMQKVSPWLGSLRLRAAHGSSGVQPGPTTKISQMLVRNGFVDGQVQNGAFLITLANPNLKAERQTEFEGGLDAELWHRRLTLEATYYTRHSSDALVDVPLPQSVGISTEEQNVGSIQNRGIEGAITIQVLSWRDATLDLGVSGSTNHSKVLALAPGVSRLAPIPGFYPVESRVGYSMDGVWARPLLSYNPTPAGGIITANDITVGDTAVYLGTIHPTREFSGTGKLSLFGGRVQLSALFDYRGGFKYLDLNGFYRCVLYQNCREGNDPSAPLADQARFVWLGVSGNYFFIYDGDYVRWRELALTLAAPDRLAHAMGFRSASLTLTGRNLGLWTKTPGIDPERQYLDNQVAPGYNAAAIYESYGVPTAPLTRYWIARVNLGF